MSVERGVPSARQTPPGRLAGVALAALVAAAAACGDRPEAHVLLAERSPDGQRVAMVRLAPCGGGWCESLWVGPSPDRATRIATLAKDAEHCDEIVWRRDGNRVGFLVDGHQLRIYDPETQAPAGQVDLVANDGRPTTRIARGVTFSGNGVAVTFDDCPRNQSGCRPGMIGIR
jgi:hypothetical protein